MVRRRDVPVGRASQTDLGDAAPSDNDILEALSDGVMLCDRTGAIQRVNARAAQLLQRLPADLLDLHVSEVVSPDDHVEFAERLRAPEQPAAYELSLRRADGSEVVVHVGQRPVRVRPEAVDYVLLTVTDLTDFQRTHNMLQGRLRELAWFQQVSLDREARILELKRENDRLRSRLGLPTTQPARDALQDELNRRLRES